MELAEGPVIPVFAAVIERNGCFLLAQRPRRKRHGGMWEFPGGKFEPGEDVLAVASRELAEELGVRVLSVGSVQMAVHDPGSQFEIRFVSTSIEGEPTALEHESLAWARLEDFIQYSFAPSDARFAAHLLRKAR